MKLSYICEKGSSAQNEDSYLVEPPIFGVFDGSTSLDKYHAPDGRTGGLLASSIARNVFSRNNKSLYELALNANMAIESEMNAQGIPANKINRWSTTAAVVRLDDNYFDWLQIADSNILVLYNDGSHKLLVPDYAIGTDVLLYCKKLASKGEIDWSKVQPELVKLRNTMNESYGVLSGEPGITKFLKSGRESLDGVTDILIFTDGMLIPNEDPSENDDFDTLVNLYLENGLEGVKNYVRNLERSDPDCLKYPRFKPHDDLTAIALSFER